MAHSLGFENEDDLKGTLGNRCGMPKRTPDEWKWQHYPIFWVVTSIISFIIGISLAMLMIWVCGA